MCIDVQVYVELYSETELLFLSNIIALPAFKSDIGAPKYELARKVQKPFLTCQVQRGRSVLTESIYLGGGAKGLLHRCWYLGGAVCSG